MDEIKEFVFDDVMFQLRTFHNINTSDDAIIVLVNKHIDEEYNNFVKSEDLWEPEPYISRVIERIITKATN